MLHCGGLKKKLIRNLMQLKGRVGFIAMALCGYTSINQINEEVLYFPR
jgi:hypothetical protein